MRILVSIVLQALFVGLALATTLLRCWVRIGVEKRFLTLPDYLVWCGWLCTLGWFICSVVALRIQIDHPLVGPDLTTDSVNYLVTVFVASYLFDVGLYFPKAALIAFYWWLISPAFRRLRIALRVGTAYLVCAFVASLLVDTLICLPISHNWSIENQLSSLWNTYAALAINWALNWSTDLLLFILPFFMLNFLTLTKRQKIALCGVFSLGLFTIIISLARFLVYTLSEYYSLDDASGNLWCTAEICIATIVVSLPTLKVLITRPRVLNALKRGREKELNSGSDKHADTFGSRSSNRKSWGHIDTFRSHVQAEPRDDEIELVTQRSRRSSRSPIRITGAKVENNAVRITTDVTISRDRLSSIS